MSKKILTVLAPVAAIVAFMAIPSLAQANTTQAQCGSVECTTGQAVIGQAGELVTKTQNPTGKLTCPSGEAAGEVTAPQGDHVTGQITSFVLPQTGCLANEVPAHVFTNAGNAGEDWTLQIQQPDASGNVIAHIIPSAGKKIQFSVQIQVFGGSVATCHFASDSVQLTGTAQSDVLTIDNTNAQFELEARQGIAANECGTPGTTVGHLEGSIQLETATGAAVVVHQS